MDILDIDEVLKDDSLIFLTDKAHDDVSNILQQWKVTLSHSDTQNYTLNSKTYTRPKRKSVQNLDLQFSNNQKNGLQSSSGTPGINMEIGGLVTTLQKTYLQDTSPPSSISSSMGISVDRMNNSLVTSADFANLNFLPSPQNLDKKAEFDPFCVFQAPSESIPEDSEYTLSDMIRDRNALESLTMSVDETLIKDMHIAGIDDISLTFSKTASSNSTMDNSTDSTENNNRAMNLTTIKRIEIKEETFAMPNSTMPESLLMNNELISGTTYNLLETSLRNTEQDIDYSYEFSQLPTSLKLNSAGLNETYKKSVPKPDETICIKECINDDHNIIHTPPSNSCREELMDFKTPENVAKSAGILQYFESTPYIESNHKSLERTIRSGTPSLSIKEVENFSPIAHNGDGNSDDNSNQIALEGTFNCDSDSSFHISNETAGILQGIESYNSVYNKTFDRNTIFSQKNYAVVNLEEVDVEKLAQYPNEDEFEHLLNELSKVEPSAEEIKMRKSLEGFKKRFSYCNASINGHMYDEMEVNMPAMPTQTNEHVFGDTWAEMKTNSSCDATICKELSSSGASPLTTSSVSSQSSERLLNRRSRLFDDIGVVSNLSNAELTNQNKLNSASFIIHKDLNSQEVSEPNTVFDRNEFAEQRKLSERRERDRDRFKTISISDPQAVAELPDAEATAESMSFEGKLTNLCLKNCEIKEKNETRKTNYLTYKKSKDKVEIQNQATTNSHANASDRDSGSVSGSSSRSQYRSLSRPRILSGLQRCSTVSKANSASDLPQKTNSNNTLGVRPSTLQFAPNLKFESSSSRINTERSAEGYLKSPMGVKSKSFHNLSGSYGLSNGLPAPRLSFATSGLRRPNASNLEMQKKITGGIGVSSANEMKNEGDSIFKVPKLVSGLRNTSAPGAKRGEILRPSSGYFSLNVPNRAPSAVSAIDHREINNTNSENTELKSSRSNISNNRISTPNERVNQRSSLLTGATTRLTNIAASQSGSTGIPKASGLKPPSNLKRSGLPRPLSIARR